VYRVVIRNLHHSVQQEEVRQETERLGHKIIILWNIRHRVTGNLLSLLFPSLEPANNNNEICRIEYLKNTRVQIGPHHQKQNNMPKCKRCEAYFHTKGHCTHIPRWVKRGKPHNTEECTLPKTQLTKCLHCGESHPVS
jgi:hypothetical protein